MMLLLKTSVSFVELVTVLKRLEKIKLVKNKACFDFFYLLNADLSNRHCIKK